MRSKQLKLNIYKGRWGGRRPGSGRKRIHSKGVSHRTRERVTNRTPLHVNFKFKTYIKNKYCLRLLKKAIMNARSQGLKIIHFSLQSNHIHLLIESESNAILTRGMRSLTVTFAKGLRTGKVQVERYHLHVLKTIREAKNAALYVLFNQQKHERRTYSKVDGYSSLLSMERGKEIIRSFAKREKITIKIKQTEKWLPDRERSFLMKQGILLILKES